VGAVPQVENDACSELETVLLDIKYLHARHHSHSGAFEPVIKFYSDSVFEAALTSQMCAHLGVGVQFSAPYAHHMLGKAERPWRTIRDNASAMLHNMAAPNSMWSCVVSTFLYLRNRTYNRLVGPNGGVPLTLLTSSVPDASKFRVFGCAVFAKVPEKLRRKLSEKAFRGVMVGSPTDAPGYCVYNPETRRITTSVHVVFHEDTPGFGTQLSVDSVITDSSDDVPAQPNPQSYPIDITMPYPLPPSAAPRLPRLRSHPIRYGEMVAHLSD
jgi:hypothetical protein